MTKILVVDDEPPIVRALQINLTARGFAVCTAGTGEQALQLAAREKPDAVILDLGLPGIDGVEVVAGLRGWTEIPIVVLSARDDETAKIAALDAGADDYVTKPFSVEELLARLRAALRRAQPVEERPTIETVHFRIDLAAKRVTREDGEDIHLTPTEWQFLELLARNPGRLVTQRRLTMEVWGGTAVDEAGSIRFHLAQLRRKLEPDPSRPLYLHTEPGMGYRFTPAMPDAASRGEKT